jgi:hypothetical protein
VTDGPGRFRDELAAAATIAVRSPAPDVAALARLLYDRWYAPASAGSVPPVGPAQMVAHLRAADATGARFEAGWVVVDPRAAARQIGPAASPWQVAGARGAELLWLDPVDVVYPGRVGVRPGVGAAIMVSQRRDSTTLVPGWWTKLSPAWSEARPPILRVYWSSAPAALGDLVDALTRRLDPRLPYGLKCPLDPRRCLRPDGVVLYLPVAAWSGAKDAIRVAHDQVAGSLRPATPSFTLELAPGLAVAEDPGEESYGMHRCGILARGMWSALASGDLSAVQRAAEAALLGHGLRLEAPYLNPGSAAGYSL